MRKNRFIWAGLYILAACCSAIVTSSASAATEILVNGGAAEGKAFEMEGLLELIKLTEAGSREILERIDCNGILDGTFETGSKILGWIEDLLDTSGNVIGEELTGVALKCTVASEAGALTDCKTGEAKVWVDGLNLTAGDLWHIELVLDEPNEEWLLVVLSETNLAGISPGAELECTSLIGATGSELCNGAEPTFHATNDAATTPASILGEIKFTEATTEAEMANCTMTGNRTNGFEGSFNMWGIEGGKRVATTLNK